MTSSTPEVRSTRVVSVTITSRNTRLTVGLDDGRTISAPLEWYPRLQHGSPRERRNWRLVGEGSGIHWPDLDEDISVDNLLSGRRSGEGQRSFQRWLEGRPARNANH